MATTTFPARTRADTTLARAAAWTVARAPGAGRALARLGRRARSLILHVGGLGCLTAAAWTVALPLGLLAAGVSLLALEYLSAPSQR